MALLSKKTFIGIKTETTQGTAVVPSTSTDYLLAMDVEVKPSVEVHERDYLRSSFDRLAHVIGKKFSTIKFKTEIKGSGTPGSAYSPLGDALQACGFVETENASTSVVYTPTSSAVSSSFYGPGKSVTIEIYKDGLKHICAGCLGNVKFSFEAGKIAFAEFDFQGLYSAVTTASNPSPTFISTLPPIVSSATVSVVDGNSYIANKLDIEVGNSVQQREDVNSSGGLLGFIITGRNPKGSVSFEADSVQPWSDFVAGTEGNTDVVVGSASGNTSTFAMAKTQYQDISYADKSGIIQYNASLAFNQSTSAGNNWITITQT